MTTMKSLVDHEYAGRKLSRGDEFECEEIHVALLKLIGRAELVKEEPVYKTRDMAAEVAPRYKTKDTKSTRARRGA